MLLNNFQKTVVEMATSKAKVGILKDKLHQAVIRNDFEAVKEIKEQLVGFVEVNLDGYGERGSGKTSGTIEAATMAGLAALYINPAQWVDNADAVGMPKVIEVNGKKVTKNMVRDFFPQLKLDENGERMIREDGGYVIDFEAVKEYIANYEDLMVIYKGDVNQCPGLVVIWDEFNRIVAQDVQQLMYSVMLNHKIGDYAFPKGSFFVALTNPNTGDYNVSSIMEEEAMKDRFCHVQVENSINIFNGYMIKNKFHWSIKALANANPETVQPVGEDYDLNIKPSNRSMEMMSSLLNFTNIETSLENGDFLEVVAGLLGTIYAARLSEIMEKGAEKVPTGEEIITKYDEFREMVQAAKNENRQDYLNQAKENFLSIMTEPETIEKYEMRATKKSDGTVIIPDSLDNVFKFFQDVPAEFRVAMVKQFVEIPKVHPVIALHQELYNLVKEDIKRSNQKGKAKSEASVQLSK
ncbi:MULTISPECIES: hypothetical protein [Bacillus cereus group]|uniref:hypothetical protein n=1 Tax=Bacillus cereus group TaxID=86661 RepID=UPI0022E7B030|nr:hypothetical protein [Bacillus cereus group sp. TH152-1LC]MDA1674791.1 hypothetical protein [Bacillus cereus group sp. TH152-1LC]